MSDPYGWPDSKPEHRPKDSDGRLNPLDLVIIKPNDDRIKITCKEVQVSVERRLQRTILRGGEGDDMEDQGSESALYSIRAEINSDKYLELMDVFRGTQPRMIEPFDGREIKVAFSNISYSASTKELRTDIIEDIA